MLEMPPFVYFVVAALLVPFLKGSARKLVALAAPVLCGLALLGAEPGTHFTYQLFDYELALFRVDKLSLLFGYLFSIAGFLSILFSLHMGEDEHPVAQYAGGLLYAGSAVGAVFAADFITLFIFWEGLAFSSVFLIWARGDREALASGVRYLIINVLSGVILLAGALAYFRETGSLTFDFIGLGGLASWLILIAFGMKAAFPLVHNWLTDAYPTATATGTVFLSAFTSKVAIYSLARGFPGTDLLLYIGVTMACFAIFWAVIENDLRRVLSYSMVNQLGFMVAGVGVGGALGVNGAVAHAFADVLFKGLLMMSMGAVLYRVGHTKASHLGGLYKSMPITTGLCIVGAASISAFPLFSAFVTKSMIMLAVLEEGHTWLWLLLLFASAGVVEHAGIKIPYFAFFAHDSGVRVKEAPKNMLFAMAVAAVLSIGIGVYPQGLYALLPMPVEYEPYTVTHVVTQLQLLFFAIAAIVTLHRTGLYPAEIPSVNLDFEWTYRKLAPRVVRAVGGAVSAGDRGVRQGVLGTVGWLLAGVSRHGGPSGALGRSWPTGSMIMWAVVLLAAYLVFGLVA